MFVVVVTCFLGTCKPPDSVVDTLERTSSGAGELDPKMFRLACEVGTESSEYGCICHIVNVGSKESCVETRCHSECWTNSYHDLSS